MFNKLKTVIVIMLLAATAVFSMAPAAYGETGSGASPNKFVGTFFGTTTNVMVSIHADGTVDVVDPNMFNFLEKSYSTPSLGVWKIVGGNTIRLTYVFFSTEDYGDKYLPNGLILRVSLLAEFDDPVEGKSPGYTTSETEVAVFFAGQNPTTDEPFHVVTFPDGSGTRLEAE